VKKGNGNVEEDYVVVEPNWTRMFEYGEELLMDAPNFSGKELVLEMYRFGMHVHMGVEETLDMIKEEEE
jgi:hypothetical protein